MRYTYTTGYPDFLKAQKTYTRSNPLWRVKSFLSACGKWLLFTLGFVMSLGLVVFRVMRGEWPDSGISNLIAGVVIMAIAFAAPLMRQLQLRQSYKIFNGNPKAPVQAYLEINNEVLISGIEGHSEGRFQRSAICKSLEDEQMLLLFLTKKKFIFIPKQALSAETMQDLHTWLALPGETPC